MPNTVLEGNKTGGLTLSGTVHFNQGAGDEALTDV